MDPHQLIPHLFRTEYRKIASVLCKKFGIDHIGLAEDIASETFAAAVETWSYKGIPPNPTAWLYVVAKNKAKNHLTRNNLFKATILPELRMASFSETDAIDLSENNITDSQLQMLFALCHPAISPEAQVALSLRILCGFGIGEIADAFLTTRKTINKRLFRAREKLRETKIPIALPTVKEIDSRLESVLTTLYLLFSEGYYSGSNEITIRKELCIEAMRLTYMLVDNEQTNKPAVNALLAMMCFYASRLEARAGRPGQFVLYEDQDIALWNQPLIAKGVYFFHQAANGNTLSKYHIEAGIAYWHTRKTDPKEKWENILQLYNQLLMTAYSPIAALNRTYALSQAYGNEEAIAEAEKLNLTDNHFYFTLLGELYKDINPQKARSHFETAYTLAKTQTDQQTIQRKMDHLI